jgi:hypothetical protein
VKPTNLLTHSPARATPIAGARARTVRFVCCARSRLGVLLLIMLQAPGAWAGSAPPAPPEADARPSPGNAARLAPRLGPLEREASTVAGGRGQRLFVTQAGAALAVRRANGGDVVITVRLTGGRRAETVGELAASKRAFIAGDGGASHRGVLGYGRRVDPHRSGATDRGAHAGGDSPVDYQLRLAPGVDPARVTLAFEGVDSIDLAGDGSARLRLLGGGEIRQPRPQAFQVDGRGTFTPLFARYLKRGRDRLGFFLGPHDRRLGLLIDPVSSLTDCSASGTSPCRRR